MKAFEVATIVMVVLVAVTVMILIRMLLKLWRRDREETKWILLGLWMTWLFTGWAPAGLLTMTAPTRLVYEIGVSLFIANGLSWLISVCAYG